MIPSTLPRAAWWPLVGAALAHLLGDPADEQHCRRAAIRALVDKGMHDIQAATLLVLYCDDADAAAGTLLVELANMQRKIPTIAECTGAHRPGPRRIAGPAHDWCVPCDAPIPLDPAPYDHETEGL